MRQALFTSSRRFATSSLNIIQGPSPAHGRDRASGPDRVPSPLPRAGGVERSEGEGFRAGFAHTLTGPSPAAETATSPASGKRWSTAIILASLFALVSGDATAENWPGFHGLQQNGIVKDAKLPDSWNDSSYQWRVNLETRDVGSMAIQDGAVYFVASLKDQNGIQLVSLNLKTGKTNWTKDLPNEKNHLHSRNTLASTTPACDAEHVYLAHSDRQHTWLRCFTHSGQPVWERELGIAHSQHGFGTSPTVAGNKVLLNFSQQAEEISAGQPGTSRVIAFDSGTGKTIWATALTSTRVCYGVPKVVGDTILGANTGDGIYALSLDNGAKRWNAPVFSKRCVSTAVVADDVVLATCGSGGGGNYLVAVRMPSKPGEEPTEVYRIKRGAPYVPTSVVHNGLLFMIDDRGIASCVDAMTGDTKWSERIGGNFGASPIIIGDRCLLISLDGKATVLRAAATFEKLATIDLGAPVGATPAVADGLMLIRCGTEIRCLELK